MSRSFLHNPFRGVTTARSEKWWKRLMAKRFRLQVIKGDDPVLPVRKRDGDRGGPKDGKWRFSPERYPHLLRK